jgi:hypothetical protein
MFLFYTFMCRNYQEIQVETLLESNWDFPEICAKTLFEDGHVTGRSLRQTENSSTTKL